MDSIAKYLKQISELENKMVEITAEEQNKIKRILKTGQSQRPLLLLLLSQFSHVQLCATPQMAAHQAPPSLGFSRQEHWSGLPFASPQRPLKHTNIQIIEVPEEEEKKKGMRKFLKRLQLKISPTWKRKQSIKPKRHKESHTGQTQGETFQDTY